MLKPGFLARSLDQDTAHGLSGSAEKMRAVLPRSITVGHQSQPGLMDQGRRLKRLASHLMRHARGRQPPQLSVYQREQLLGGAFLAATNCLKNLRDFSSLRHNYPNFTPA
jgi:hypothetical protein